MASIKWHLKGFRELRTLEAIAEDVRKRAERVADAAGSGYKVESGITGGRGRARSSVWTGTYDAMRDNAKNNSLVRAIDAGR